jgi:hypothetical protein
LVKNSIEILYRQVHKNLGGHVFSFDVSVPIAYCSVMAFRLERPASNSLPIMLFMLKKRCMTFAS